MVVKPNSGGIDTFLNGTGTFTVPANSATVSYANVNLFPSDNLHVLLGDGSNAKISNSQIVDNSLAPSKLVLPSDSTKYLNGVGLFSVPNPNVPYTNINSFPSDNLHVLLGDGTNTKVSNNLITNNTIDPLKLTSNFVSGAYLNSNGTFTVPPNSTFSLTSTNGNVVYGDGTYGKVSNLQIANNTIDPLKLTSNNLAGGFLNPRSLFHPPLVKGILNLIRKLARS